MNRGCRSRAPGQAVVEDIIISVESCINNCEIEERLGLLSYNKPSWGIIQISCFQYNAPSLNATTRCVSNAKIPIHAPSIHAMFLQRPSRRCDHKTRRHRTISRSQTSSASTEITWGSPRTDDTDHPRVCRPLLRLEKHRSDLVTSRTRLVGSR